MIYLEDIINELVSINEEILLADGFDNALIGYVQIFNNTVALYDRDKCIDILIKQFEMTFEEAIEYFDFNVAGAYMGENTPAFATLIENGGII